MSTTENKAVVRRWIEEVANRHDPDALETFFASDLVSHQPGGDIVRGLATWKALVTEYLAAFPDYRLQIESMIAEDDLVAVRWTATGTQQGPFRGVAPSGEAVRIQGMEFDRVTNGKVTETWSEFDWHALLHRLGERRGA